MPPDLPPSLSQWARANLPVPRHLYWGLSGSTMLFEALGQTPRRTVVMPAFICPTLPAMALRAGKEVVHIDVNPDTLMMDRGQLEQCLREYGDRDTVLLVDHAFGYPCAALPDLQARHPELLIVEDSVRALGARIDGEAVGRNGDWVLFSLYKTIPGNQHGAVLLTRLPCQIRSGPAPRATLRERLATFGPARWAYERIKRWYPDCLDSGADREAVSWEPVLGMPNRLTLARFGREASRLEEETGRRRQAAREIQEGMDGVTSLRFIQPGPACEPSAYFLSFTVTERGLRNRLLTDLHRRGLFLVYAWDAVPAFFRCFRDSFPFGCQGSIYLAEHVCHVPILGFLARRNRDRLIKCLREVLIHG